MSPLRFAAIAVVAAWLLAGGAPSAGSMVAVAANAAALVAARERRHRHMALAAGIAVGTGSVGLALLPVLVGNAIGCRVARAASPLFVVAAVASAALLGWTSGIDASLLTILPTDATILLPATAIGTGAWLAASCSARPLSPREFDAAALLACVALPLLAPVGIEAAGLAIALAMRGTPLTLAPITRGANNDPLPLRALPA